MLSIQLNQVLRWWSGMIFSRPSRTASAACLPISPQLTYHWGFISGSTMSLDRLLGQLHHWSYRVRLVLNGTKNVRNMTTAAFHMCSRLQVSLTCKQVQPWDCLWSLWTGLCPWEPVTPPSSPQNASCPGKDTQQFRTKSENERWKMFRATLETLTRQEDQDEEKQYWGLMCNKCQQLIKY